MKTGFRIVLTLCIAAVLSSAWGQPSPRLSDAIKQLREVSNYSWTTRTDFLNAPFKIVPLSGNTDSSGTVMLKSKDGKRFAIIQGGVAVLKTNSGWRRVTLASEKDPADHDLLNAKTPPNELAGLGIQWTEIRDDRSQSHIGTLDVETAKARLKESLNGRAPGGRLPEITSASGRIQLWLTNGLPQKYTLTIQATLSLPLGTREVTCISTTEIGEVGSATMEVPMEARRALQSLR